MKTKEPLQLNNYRVLDDKEYTHYREYPRITKGSRIKGRTEYKKFTKHFYKIIAEELVEREGGVCIKDLGYWFIWKPPKKIIAGYFNKEGHQEMYSFVTNQHLYFPTFWATDRLLWWCMDKTFNNTLKNSLQKKIKSGKKYKMYLSTIKQLRYI